MLVLTIRTDKPEAELSLYKNKSQLTHKTWLAHRQLAETLHQTIIELLQSQNLALSDLEGIVVYEGPGSFTGLRIGISVAQAIGYGLNVPVIAEGGNDWAMHGLVKLANGAQPGTAVLPVYGSDPHITPQKK